MGIPLEKLSEKLRRRIIADNPDVFRPVEAKIAQPDQRGEGQNPQLETGPRRLAYRVSLVVLSRRAMDAHDNLPFSPKPLADAIAESLGLDDAKIEWEYAQAKTSGAQGVVVKIEAS